MTHIYLLKEISVNNNAAADTDAINTNKKVILENCDCISKINNTQVDNAKDIDTVMPICKTFGS